jgi:hypothetical protein
MFESRLERDLEHRNAIDELEVMIDHPFLALRVEQAETVRMREHGGKRSFRREVHDLPWRFAAP